MHYKSYTKAEVKKWFLVVVSNISDINKCYNKTGNVFIEY